MIEDDSYDPTPFLAKKMFNTPVDAAEVAEYEAWRARMRDTMAFFTGG